MVLISVFLVWETTLIKFKSSFSPKARKNLSIIDRIIEDTRFFFAFFDFSPKFEQKKFRLILGVKTCEVFLCFVAIVRVRAIMLSSLFSLFYVTGECHRFLHRG